MSPILDDINVALEGLENELKNTKSASETIKKASDILNQFSAHSGELKRATQNLVDATGNLIEKINKIDFPSRLDKLDNTISGVIADTRNIQSRLESVERNLNDKLSMFDRELMSKLRTAQEATEKVILDTQFKLESIQNANIRLSVLTLMAVICSLILIVLIRYKII